MTNVLQIRPSLNFPIGRVFEVTDEFNGHQRGTFYFRSLFTHQINGPYKTQEEAAYFLLHDHNEDNCA